MTESTASIAPSAPRPVDEVSRLHNLRQYHILDTAPEQSFDDLACLAALICGTPIAEIAFIDAERQWSKAVVGTDRRDVPRDIAFCSHTILSPGLTVVPDMRKDARFADNPLVTGEPYVRFYADVSLLSDEGFVLGTICVVDFVPRTLTGEQEGALHILARQVTHLLRANLRLIERKRLLKERERLIREREHVDAVLDFKDRELDKLHAELKALLTTDGLTGLYDHRAFQECLVEEVHRAWRYKTPLSLILLDLDAFKRYNDAFGHPAGDEALRVAARLLKEGARETDVVARYGGEEFVLILPQTDGAGAMVYAERVRSALENHPWPLRLVTASFGVAALDLDSGEDGAGLVVRADKLLYEAKAAGGNIVVCDSDLPGV